MYQGVQGVHRPRQRHRPRRGRDHRRGLRRDHQVDGGRPRDADDRHDRRQGGFRQPVRHAQPGQAHGAAATLAEAKAAGAVTVNYGLFINAVINFFLIAFAVFLLVKFVNQMRAQMAGTKECGAAARGSPVAARDPRRAQAHSVPDEPLVECVPNVSEGRDPDVIAALAAAVAAVRGVSCSTWTRCRCPSHGVHVRRAAGGCR